ncbi:phospholipase [Blastocystis sp. subtype 4]|uniref:phospholipase n=1 Tax=Blastocystis sp. subtype 4 TaxID=944170 RepID=UPI00071221D8|nr:phospholipase [Blastocystis sp. subtype 4]KNB43003.1 phospholipase [Blastocystis sp. subtype 4]|eukprot:XP_014526446.1 phospholipase [Blastocystis sp. subtype 4]
MKRFGLCGQLIGHRDAVRCCVFLDNTASQYFAATGGQDNSIMLWKRAADGFEAKTIHHSCWITCLLALKGGGFVSGGYDGVIRIYNKEGEIITDLSGHSSGITSLSHGPNHTIISGSWDGSFRIWSLDFVTEIEKHMGLENSVSAIALTENRFVATSSGLQIDNTVTAYAVRIYDHGECIKRFSCHYASIRCSAVCNRVPQEDNLQYPDQVIGFVTGANDGKLAAYDIDGNPLYFCETPPNAEEKYPFILRVKSIGSDWHLSCSDDDCMRIWQRADLFQEIKHPNCVWDVDFKGIFGDEKNGSNFGNSQNRHYYLLTACGDGTVRIWSDDELDLVTESERKDYERLCSSRESRIGEGSSVDVSTLPTYENRFEYTGKKDGEIRLFQKQGMGYAYRWSMESGTWIEIGQVMGEKPVSLPIEIETPSGIQTLTLEYLPTQNPYEVAQDFIDKHQLNQDYLDEIAQYILRNRGTRTQTIQSNGSTLEGFSPKLFPDNQLIMHTKLNKNGIVKKLTEFNVSLQNTSSRVFTDEEILAISALVDRISEFQNTGGLLSDQELGLLMELMSWPNDVLFPVLDIVKNALFFGNGYLLLTENPNFDLTLFIDSVHVGETPSSLLIVLYRLLTNLPQIFALTKVVTILQEKPLQQAIASFLQNASVVCSQLKKEHVATQEIGTVFDNITAVSCDLLRIPVDETTELRVLTALGNCIFENERSVEVVDEVTISVLTQGTGNAVSSAKKREVFEMIKHVKRNRF